ncbi:GDP-perosamine N-acetyltransferase [Ralstonia edaphis]|uniref:acetyltransferase n=1 Tax=Ralstonia TaxID=48736 RepID=UPI0028F64F26|nr:acetyltransferase [Ralstonia sp. LMG 6871]CAJ0715301.1 GDP-perosamine N-acetyltransferase [Ralstonia sp. LMG 6871]
MKRFAIFGASGFGREVLPVMREQLERTESGPWDLVFVDDAPPAATLNGHRVLTYDEWMQEPAEVRNISLAIANSQVREALVERCSRDGVRFYELRAANVVSMDAVQIGEGAILCPFVTITSNVRIGTQFHANIYSYVAHDCVIGDFVTFAPGVQCNGNVLIEDHAYIGTGAILRQGKPGEPLVIGRGAVIGMGAVVTKNVAAGITVVGNPAKPLERKAA